MSMLFDPLRVSRTSQLRPLYMTTSGTVILQKICSILRTHPTVRELIEVDRMIANEIVEEGRLLALIQCYGSGISIDAKMEILREAGFDPYIDNRGRVSVYFASSYAPEYDSWVRWDEQVCPSGSTKWQKEGF